MRKMILMAVAGYLWRKYKARNANREPSPMASRPVPSRSR
jgi:hypothetical protein